MNQTLKNGEKPNFGSDFGSFALNSHPVPHVPNIFMGFTSARCQILLQVIITCNSKKD